MSDLTPFNKRNNNIDKKTKELFDVERIFESLFNDAFFPALYGGGNIKVDILENDKEYVVEAELPGIRKEEINIDLKYDKLTISVRRNEELNEERDNYIRKERKLGSLSRVFYLPNIKEDEVKAKFSNGILILNLPKTKDAGMSKSKIEIE